MSNKMYRFIIRLGYNHRFWIKCTLEQMYSLINQLGGNVVYDGKMSSDDKNYKYVDYGVVFNNVINISLNCIGYDRELKKKIINDIRKTISKYGEIAEAERLLSCWEMETLADRLCEDKEINSTEFISVIYSKGTKAKKHDGCYHTFLNINDVTPQKIWYHLNSVYNILPNNGIEIEDYEPVFDDKIKMVKW